MAKDGVLFGKTPAALDDTHTAELTDQVEEPGPGQPYRRMIADGDQRKSAVGRVGLYADDGAIDSTGAAGNVHPLKGRPGRGRRYQDPSRTTSPVGDHHFTVGTQVDGGHGAGGPIEPVVGQAGQGVGADKPADERRERDLGPSGEGVAESGSPRTRPICRPHCIQAMRLEGQLGQGVDRVLEQEMVHHAVADDRHFLDALPDPARELEGIDCLDDGR